VATFAERAQVAQDVGFRARVGIALTRVAITVPTEAKPRPAWTSKRIDLATRVLVDPQAMAARFSLILASQDVPLAATDEELETKTREAWDAIAGVAPEDRP
jgi:hypothetical protein